jgi:beta-galactosidase
MGDRPGLKIPPVVKSGINQQGKIIHYYFNYAPTPATFTYPHKNGMELLKSVPVASQQSLEREAWGVIIIEEN